MTEKGLVISAVCDAVKSGTLDVAESILRRDYPFAPTAPTKRQYGCAHLTRLFVRDGFIDRYTGERLVFPPVLRILSSRVPNAFPYQSSWKTELTHPAYWELFPTLDHVVPVSRGGLDSEANWVTTSMARNSAKGNWTVEELGWNVLPPGDFATWDGLLKWFLEYVSSHPEELKPQSVRQWHRPAVTAVAAS